MTITLISRKPTSRFFSIEKVFNSIQSEISSKEISIRTVYLPFQGNGLLGIAGNLIFLFLLNKKGIFHVTGHAHYALLALPSRSTVLTIHDLIFLHSYSGIRRNIIKYLFLDLPVKKASYISTISEKSKAEIIEYTHCDPNKIKFIPNPIHPVFNSETSFHKSSIPVILFIGTFPNKNLELSIVALSGLNIHLRVIGALSQAQKDLLEKWKIKFSQSQNLTDKELAEEYNKASILLFPSLYEGFGLPIIEAFQSKLPVITSAISPMKEVAGDAAILIDPHSVGDIRNAVKLLMSNEELRQSLIAKGVDQVKQYQPKQIANEYKILWQHVWNKRNTTL